VVKVAKTLAFRMYEGGKGVKGQGGGGGDGSEGKVTLQRSGETRHSV